MKKRIITIALAIVIILGLSAIPAFAASNLSANPTASTVYVNGAAKEFEAYIINGNNYFKLRDLAYVMNGTAKQFEVGYDSATKAITLTTGKAYTPDGGEMAKGDGKAKTASPTASKIYLNGKELSLTVYLIGGNNFFKLRDLMEAIDVFVGYDNATKAITLDTSKGYVPEGSATTPVTPTPSGVPQGNSGIIGVWLGTSTPNFDWEYIIFYGDGTFRFQLPREGFYGFDRAKDKANNQGSNIWGTYSFSGNTGIWKYDAASASSTITLESDGGLNLGTSYNKFYRCNSVDNYKLNGSYTSYSDPSDPDLTKPGKKPVIHFKSDGTFTDDGLFSMVTYLQGIGETEEESNPGSGTYEIKEFTLILRYSDGRVTQTSFTLPIGPNSTDASVYALICNGFEFRKIP